MHFETTSRDYKERETLASLRERFRPAFSFMLEMESWNLIITMKPCYSFAFKLQVLVNYFLTDTNLLSNCKLNAF